MENTLTSRKRVRRYFGRLMSTVPMPNLIEVQKSSYEFFLQRDIEPDNRIDAGLQEVFKSVFPDSGFC
jgi:DNA-directed RNA polymerase subunit beta